MKKKQKLKSKYKAQIIKTAIAAGFFVVAIFVANFLVTKTPTLPSPPLKDLAAAHGIELGVHTSLSRIGSKAYDSIVTSQFSFATIDGEANWQNLEPSLNQFNYSGVDKLISFARSNNMPVQIHHLIWGEQAFLPNWLKNGNYSPAQLSDLMHNYITNVVGHYKGQVAVWSVVNEAFSRSQHEYGLSDWWADHMNGLSYIDNAFIWAHQADPKAKLIVNDFANGIEDSVSNSEYNFLKTALAQGVPIQGVGMQMHINAADPPTVAAMVQNMQRFASLGLPIYITEFDVNLNSVQGSASYKQNLEDQIDYNVASACIQSKDCVSFDVFGVSDKENWLKSLFNTNSHSYLFTSRYVPKSAFYSFRSAWLQPQV